MPGVTIATSTEVTGASARGELTFASGETRAADFLAVGVDGVWSKVRESLGLERSHEQTVEGALRTMVGAAPGDFGPDDVGKYIECWNGARRFLVTPVNESQTYLALTCPDTDARGPRDPGRQGELARCVSAMDASHRADRRAPRELGRVQRHALQRVVRRRTAIVGDAAHAQTPNLGQGGGMAMQNGLALAVALENVTDRRDIPDALERWEAGERDIVEHKPALGRRCTARSRTCRTTSARRVIRGAMSDPWIAGQVFRAANHAPVGTVPPRE